MNLDNAGNLLLPAELLHYIAKNDDVLWGRAQEIIAAVADEGVGLGEVLQDYAVQTRQQVTQWLQAEERARAGEGEEEAAIAAKVPSILRSVTLVLDMTAPAMQRNRADVIGEGISPQEVAQVAREFKALPPVARALTLQECCA